MPALRSLARSALALAAALAITVCGAAPAVAVIVEPDVPPASERATATVHPALVRVTGTFMGRVHNREGGYANNGEPYVFLFTCSGFGVHPDGYIATVGHCIDANDPNVRDTFIEAAAEEAVAISPDVPLGEMIEHGHSAWAIEGTAPGSPIVSEIRVSGIPGLPTDGMLARVVDDRPIGQGDVGLLKVDTTDLPTVELATGTGLSVGMPLLVGGYSESVGERVGPGATPSFEHGAVDAVATDGGRPMYRTDSSVETGTSGGPAFDNSGRVLGINTIRRSGGQEFNLVLPIGGFTDLLARNGARAELGPRDLRYREALDAYYGGEYTDVIEAVDRLQQEGPTHPRVAQLRSDAAASRELHGDASENRTTQILVWGSAGVGALVIVVIAALVVARRRRAKRAVVMQPPPQPFPGAYGGPAGPAPAWPQTPRPAAPHHPYRPAARPPQAPPRPPAGPGPVPQVPRSFDGPTRQIRLQRPAPAGSENPTTTIATGTATPGAPAAEDRPAATTPPAAADPASTGPGS
jgi:serine protease Do